MIIHKVYRFVFVFILCIVLLSSFAFADEFDVVSEAPIEFEYTVVSSEEIRSDPDWQLTDVSIKSVVSPVDPSDTSGLKAALLGVLGNYDPVIVEYRYQNTNQTTYSYLREVQPDYVWIWSALLLIIVIWCLFRLGGAILCRK